MNDKLRHDKDQFFGAVTVGERGQIVIPAEARRALGIETGDKLIVIGVPKHSHLMICKIDSIRHILEMITDHLKRAETSLSDDSPAEPDEIETGGTHP